MEKYNELTRIAFVFILFALFMGQEVAGQGGLVYSYSPLSQNRDGGAWQLRGVNGKSQVVMTWLPSPNNSRYWYRLPTSGLQYRGSFVFVPGAGWLPSWAVYKGRYAPAYALAEIPTYSSVSRGGETVWVGNEEGKTVYYSGDPSRVANAKIVEAIADAIQARTDRYQARTVGVEDRIEERQTRRNERALGSNRYRRADSVAWSEAREGRPSNRVIRHYTGSGANNTVSSTVLDPGEQRSRREASMPSVNTATYPEGQQVDRKIDSLIHRSGGGMVRKDTLTGDFVPWVDPTAPTPAPPDSSGGYDLFKPAGAGFNNPRKN